ncbi:MAG: TerB family tellurite resistance protein, partial [Gammaproteobacteria bacterium]|nr:TerB family tellurite resistance protein [Gammaproteobacteria bacterium]
MMNKLSSWFNQSIEVPTVDDAPHELELATAALMMEVARADFEQSEEERGLMLQKLGSRLKLTDEAV